MNDSLWRRSATGAPLWCCCRLVTPQPSREADDTTLMASGPTPGALNSAKCVSSENNRQRKENNCDRHKWRASEISRQDEEDRDDSEDCCDVVLHNFFGFSNATVSAC
jgi:hypothetical protein